MAARVQRRDGVRPGTATALLRTEVGNEAGTMGRLGQAGCKARWARVVSVWAGRQAKAGEVIGPVEEGRGHEEVKPEGSVRPARLNGP
jgi:hypothetical protein